MLPRKNPKVIKELLYRVALGFTDISTLDILHLRYSVAWQGRSSDLVEPNVSVYISGESRLILASTINKIPLVP